MLLSPVRMHIPDGFLSTMVSLLTWALTIAVLSLAIRRTGRELKEHQVPLMGVMAAFIFAAQMINFPVAGGTSGHLLGGTLAAITLGPWAGMVAMASVIIVQGLLFQDGGLLSMGANVLNMGLLTVMIGYGLYRGVLGRPRAVRLATAGIAAWLSVIAGALATSLELWLSGTARLDIVVPAMLGIHALIGVGEGLITVAAMAFILRSRPDLIEADEAPRRGGRGWIAAGLLLALGVVLLAPLASTDPDGLNRVALNLGFISQGTARPLFQILPNYSLPMIGAQPVARIVAGGMGVLVVAVIASLVIWLLRRSE